MVKNLVKFLSPYKIRVIAVHRWANADEIADAYIFLLENSYMNGEVLHINGGYNYF